MRKIALIAALALALPAGAQDKPAASGAEPAKPAAPMVAETAKPKPAARKASPKRQEDARHCLEKASNEEIIKCAEAYL